MNDEFFSNNIDLKEEHIYLVYSADLDKDGKPLVEIAQYRKGMFWFFGWEVPEPTKKFSKWKEIFVSVSE
jgi:hypothetical protein